MKRFLALLLILLLCSGCTPAPTVKIGIIEPLSGQYAAAGQTEYQGILEAFAEHKTVNGQKVELVIADNLSTAEGTQSAVRDIRKAGVEAVIGSFGSRLSSVIEETITDLPHIATTAETNGTYLGLSIPLQAKALAQTVSDNGWNNVAVLCDINNPYDVALRNAFIAELGKDIIVAEAYYPSDCEDLTDYIKALEKEYPDALLIPNEMPQVLSLTTLPILGGDVWESEEVIHAVYSENGIKDVGYDAYLLAIADLEGKKEVAGKTGDFQNGNRISLHLQTPNGIKKIKVA